MNYKQLLEAPVKDVKSNQMMTTAQKQKEIKSYWETLVEGKKTQTYQDKIAWQKEMKQKLTNQVKNDSINQKSTTKP